MPQSFRKKAHEEAKKNRKTPDLTVLSDFKESAVAGETLFGFILPFSGKVTDISLDVEGIVGGQGSVLAVLEKVRSNREERQENKIVVGRNNLGSFQVSAGDRLKIIFTSEDVNVPSVNGVWFSANYLV